MCFTPMAAPHILPVRTIRRQVFSIDKALHWVIVGFINDRVDSQVAIRYRRLVHNDLTVEVSKCVLPANEQTRLPALRISSDQDVLAVIDLTAA